MTERSETERATKLADLSDGELLNYCGDNPLKWAEEFCQIKQKQGWSAADIDENLMLGWFANAIEQSSDVRGCSALPAPADANASAEARLREDAEAVVKKFIDETPEAWGAHDEDFESYGIEWHFRDGSLLYLDIDDKGFHVTWREKALKPRIHHIISTHPNASDCDKQGEAKCPECGGSGSIEIDDGHFIKCKCAPSDRTADDLPAVRSANDCNKQGER